MTYAFPLVSLVLCFYFVFGCQTCNPWELRRADPGNYGVSFFNKTNPADSSVTLIWTWKDSSDGVWDTRLKVSMHGMDEIIGGGFMYSDRHDTEVSSARWYKVTMNGSIKWKYTSYGSPPDSWWMTSLVPKGNITWGFKNQITDGSWVFRVGNDTIEPVHGQHYDGWPKGMRYRRKRSAKTGENGGESILMKYLSKIRDSSEEPTDIFQQIIGCFMDLLQMFKLGD